METVSFPLAPGVSGRLPALADIPKFKCAPGWSNEATENVRNTSGDKLPLFRNMVCMRNASGPHRLQGAFWRRPRPAPQPLGAFLQVSWLADPSCWDRRGRSTTLCRMCGIVGYVGKRPAFDVVMDALRRMEYRGYDSSGIALLDGKGKLTVCRRAGRLANLDEAVAEMPPASLAGTTGLGHTRWATHGRPTDRNAHPHCDAAGKIAVVHNGIIENYADPAPRAGGRRRGVCQRHRHRSRGAPGVAGVSPRRDCR